VPILERSSFDQISFDEICFAIAELAYLDPTLAIVAV